MSKSMPQMFNHGYDWDVAECIRMLEQRDLYLVKSLLRQKTSDLTGAIEQKLGGIHILLGAAFEAMHHPRVKGVRDHSCEDSDDVTHVRSVNEQTTATTKDTANLRNCPTWIVKVLEDHVAGDEVERGILERQVIHGGHDAAAGGRIRGERAELDVGADQEGSPGPDGVPDGGALREPLRHEPAAAPRVEPANSGEQGTGDPVQVDPLGMRGDAAIPIIVG